jgi:hypothetical protein
MLKISPILLAMMVGAAPLLAQQPATPQPPAAPADTKEPRPGPVPPGGLPLNVRVDITITDQRADAPPIVKTVTKTVADRTNGRIRTSGDVATKAGFRQVVLNVDSFPQIITNANGTPTNKLKIMMTIEYRPKAADADTEENSTPPINEQLTVFLDDGKPMVISQSADPATDRKVKVEVKATILK